MVPSRRALLFGTVCCFVFSALIILWMFEPTLIAQR
jgi:hypothetical protein